jgi:hypothetical protein
MSPWSPFLITLQLLAAAASAPAQPAGTPQDQGMEHPAVASSQPGSIARQLDNAARAEGRMSTPANGDALKPAEPGQAKPPEPTGLTPLDLTGSSDQVTSGTAFNPAMSIIPDMLYYNDSRSGEGFGLVGEADGFHRGLAEKEGHSHGGSLVPGFNLRELEVALSGVVDPYFDTTASIAVSREGLALEEVYVRTRRLPAGLQLKVGKFYSDIGYINRQHPHQWDFVNQNLGHQLLLGGEGLSEVGVQATWLPALPIYLRLGVEALQGENESLASYLGPDEDHPFLRQSAGPRLFTGFAKVSPDFGYSHAIQVGGSVVRSRTHQEDHEDHFLEGQAWLLGFDAVYKYDSPKPGGEGDLVVQGEYLRRVKDLELIDHVEIDLVGARRRFTQDGLYAQAVYGFAPRWTAAFRFDTVGLANRIEADGATLSSDGSSRRVSGNVTFNPTHFSRLRLQVDRASISVGGSPQAFTQAFVQLQLSLGVHGAHRF